MVEQEILEEIYRKYMKGEIMDRKLAYNTIRDQIFNELELKLIILIKKLREEKENE